MHRFHQVYVLKRCPGVLYIGLGLMGFHLEVFSYVDKQGGSGRVLCRDVAHVVLVSF